MLQGLVFLGILLMFYSMLSSRNQLKLLRVLIPLGLITAGFIACIAFGLIISFMAHSDGNVIFTKYFNMGLTDVLSKQVSSTKNFLAMGGLVLLMIPSLVIDVVMSTMKLAFSLKMPFLTFMVGVWFVFAMFIKTYLADPMNEMARREEELDPHAGESFPEQVMRLSREHEQDMKLAAIKKAEQEAYRKANPDAGKSQHVHGPW